MSARDRRKSKSPAKYQDTPTHSLKSARKDGPPSLVTCLFSGRALWVSLALVAAAIFIYSGVRSHDYVAWDDPVYVSENLRVAAGLSADTVRWAFTTGSMGNWHPLTWLSYMLGAQLFGMSAGSHLLANVFLHILNSLLLFALLQRMTGAFGRSAFVAVLFAVHPVHVESVAWVSERKDVLSTLFGLLALWAYVDYARMQSRVRYLVVLVLFALGLMAKPMLVTLPFLMLLLDYWPLGRTNFGALVREKLPMFVVALIFGVITVVVQQRAGAVAQFDKLSLGARIANALVAYSAYLGKMLWPMRLSALYPLYKIPVEAVVGSILVLAGVSAAVLRFAKRYPYLPMGWLWYLVTLAQVIGIIQVGSQSMADRYTYIPSIGLFVALTWGAGDLLSRVPQAKVLLPATACLLLLIGTVAAQAQVQTWTDATTLWTNAVQVNADNDVAQRLLADALSKNGKREEAISHYQQALRVNPGNAEAHNGLGLALAEQNKFAEAITQYQEALRLKPTLVDSHFNMGLAYAGQGRTEQAIEKYRDAIRIDPEFVRPRLNMGVLLANQGKIADATQQFSAVLRLRPDNADAHNNLGIVLSGQGRLPEAIEHFSAALRANPNFEAARRNLQIAQSQKAGATVPGQ